MSQNLKSAPHSPLEKLFLDSVEKDTPNRIKEINFIDLNNKGEFQVTITREHLLRNIDDSRSLADGEIRSNKGLGLSDWLKSYEKEAKVSTAGIRGLQNPLYPQDTRYPLNLFGVLFATAGKALVAQETFADKIDNLEKISASEVRYNSNLYVELIARIQAAYNIKTYIPDNYKTMPIWMISFLVFMLDLYGAEYVTSSHAISKKIATKDINFQGSQYIPEESIKFVEKIKEIFAEIESKGSYTFTVAPFNSEKIDDKYLGSINYGADLYVEYLKKSIATNENLSTIQSTLNKIVIECMGGSMYPILKDLFERLNIFNSFDFLNTEQDPFFHNIGKRVAPNGKFEDLGCDSTITEYKGEDEHPMLPVIETMDYSIKLKDHPAGTTILMTDPDGDRLVTAQMEPINRIPKLDELGITYTNLNDKNVLAIYMPNQSFLMTMDFQKKALEKSGLWHKYNWFIIKTTASAMSWDEWAEKNNVGCVNTPVGFKEIATIMLKIENQINTGKNVVITDVFGKEINLGPNPRLLFAGEESGGEIFGPAELIVSKKGNHAISMREKSAGEAIIITSAMTAKLNTQGMYLSDYLEDIFKENNIKGMFDIRIDKKYYNESESDIAKLLQEKEKGIGLRTMNDKYFLSLALSFRYGKLYLDQVKEILSETFADLDFSDLQTISFVGDGTYLRFLTKYVEVRPSGTDAINKAYAAGTSKEECKKYASALAAFDGTRNPKYIELISEDFYNSVKDESMKILIEYQSKDLPVVRYQI